MFILDLVGIFAMHDVVRKKISWKVRLLCWNQDPCLMDLDLEHLAPATFLQHRQQNPSGILGCVDHVTSPPQVLHCTLLGSKLMSFMNCIAMARSQNRYVKNDLFRPPSSRSIARPYDDLGTNGIPCRCFSYSATTSLIFCTIILGRRGWTL